jgi:hypothetical protein
LHVIKRVLSNNHEQVWYNSFNLGFV